MNNRSEVDILRRQLKFFEERKAKLTEVLKLREDLKNLSESFFKEKKDYYELVKNNPELDKMMVVKIELAGAKKVYDADWYAWEECEKEMDKVEAGIVVTKKSCEIFEDAIAKEVDGVVN